VKTIAKRTLLSLACTILLGSSTILAQQANMTAPPVSTKPKTSPAVALAQLIGEPIPAPEGEMVFETISDSAASQPSYMQEFSGQEIVGIEGGAFGDCCTDTCCAVCGEGRDCPPRLYVEQGARILTRSRTRDQLISQEFIAGFGFVPKMFVRSLNFDITAGYTITLGKYLGRDDEKRDHFCEFTYWGLNEWSETYTVNAEDGFLWTRFPSTVGGFNEVDQHTQSYQSNINNFELNVRIRPRGPRDRQVMRSGRWRRECNIGCYPSYLIGIRGLAVNEKYDLLSLGFGARDGIIGDYDIKTHNNLIGLQIGADMIFRRCKWNWGIKGKVGPYLNFSDQSSDIFISDFRVGPDTSARRAATKDDAALVAEFGFTGNYKPRPNISLRASYDFMWITGLALGPDQLDFDVASPSRINDNGNIYYHGLSLTAELIW